MFVTGFYCISAELTLASAGDIISKLRSASASLANVLAACERARGVRTRGLHLRVGAASLAIACSERLLRSA